MNPHKGVGLCFFQWLKEVNKAGCEIESNWWEQKYRTKPRWVGFKLEKSPFEEVGRANGSWSRVHPCLALANLCHLSAHGEAKCSYPFCIFIFSVLITDSSSTNIISNYPPLCHLTHSLKIWKMPLVFLYWVLNIVAFVGEGCEISENFVLCG